MKPSSPVDHRGITYTSIADLSQTNDRLHFMNKSRDKTSPKIGRNNVDWWTKTSVAIKVPHCYFINEVGEALMTSVEVLWQLDTEFKEGEPCPEKEDAESWAAFKLDVTLLARDGTGVVPDGHVEYWFDTDGTHVRNRIRVDGTHVKHSIEVIMLGDAIDIIARKIGRLNMKYPSTPQNTWCYALTLR